MAVNRDKLPEGLLDDVKNYLNITWSDEATNAKISGLIASGMMYLNSKLGAEADYTLDAGKYVRMKRLLPGEQVLMSVENSLYTTLAVGDAVQPAAGGTVAKYTAPSGGSDPSGT